jgi:8-oxo-dGTP diphosphatase
LSYTYDYPHPAVTVDIVVIRNGGGEPQVLLIRRAQEPFKGKWALPGGFVDIDEDLERAARRELEEETGLKGIPLKQLHTFGAVDRDPRERVISVAYLALVSEAVEARAGSDAAAADWFPLAALPALAFDHGEILDLAKQRVKPKD